MGSGHALALGLILGGDPPRPDTPPPHTHTMQHTRALEHLPQSPGLNTVTSFAEKEQPGGSEGEENFLTKCRGFRDRKSAPSGSVPLPRPRS